MTLFDYTVKNYADLKWQDKMAILCTTALNEEQEKAKQVRGKSLTDEQIFNSAVSLLGKIDTELMSAEDQDEYCNLIDSIIPDTE